MEINKISLGFEETSSVVQNRGFLSGFKKEEITGAIGNGLSRSAAIFKVLLTKISLIRPVQSIKAKLQAMKLGSKKDTKEVEKHLFDVDQKENIGTAKREFSKKNRKVKKFILLALLLSVLILIYWFVKNNNSSSPATNENRVEVEDAEKTLAVNKEFQFPLTDSKGEEISKIKYVIEKAELRNEIIVKGQKATAVKGRTFLVVYLKVTNEYTQKIEMQTRDYVRLSVNGNENEWLAPDIHNDPVEVQAQSTKVTRLGFPINENDTKIILRVGQINGDKEKVELNF